MASKPGRKHYIAAARKHYQREGEVEIDDNAVLSIAEGNPDKGAYVQAWVWVDDADARESKSARQSD